MIKLIREGSTKYPWLLKIIILLIAGTFMIGMGWFGYESSQQPNAVAIVGPYTVSLDEFRRTYTRMYRFYKDELKQELVDEEDLKQQVIQSMVDKKVWLVTADEWGIGISPDTLRYEIRKRKEFQTDGTFDAGLYHRLLIQNRFSPKDFEQQLTRDLQTQHAQIIVQDVATLNPSEVQEAEELAARQTAGMKDEEEIERIRKRIRLQILFQKKQRALQAFQAAKRLTSDVEIRQKYL